MREDAEALGARVGRLAVVAAAERGDGAGDRVVEAQVQGLELARGDVRCAGDGEPGDDLAEIAVVVDDLPDREPVLEEVLPVTIRADLELVVIGDLVQGGLPERVAELIEEERQALRELELRRCAPRDDQRPRLREDLVAICGNELTQHALQRKARTVQHKACAASREASPRVERHPQKRAHW